MNSTFRPNERWQRHGAPNATEHRQVAPAPFQRSVDAYVNRLAAWGALLIVSLVVLALMAMNALPTFWAGVLAGAFPSLVVLGIAGLGAFLCGVPAPGGRR